MSTKWTLDVAAMQEDFFADTALIGIASALPAYRLCWLLNKHADVGFAREADMDVKLQTGEGKETHFSVYQYTLPLSGSRHLLYKLKSEKEILLPEVKQLDYIWMVQSTTAETDAAAFIKILREVPEIQLAQILHPDKIKNISHLLV
jgi:hypothetical protein